MKYWGFKCIKDGPEKGAFFHSLFCCDKSDLCQRMIFQRQQIEVTAHLKKKNGKTTNSDYSSDNSQNRLSPEQSMQEKLLKLAVAVSNERLMSTKEPHSAISDTLGMNKRIIELLQRIVSST